MKHAVLIVSVMLLVTELSEGNEPPPLPDPTVYYALETDSVGVGRRANAALVKRMVDSLVMTVTSKPTVAEAWKSLVKPDDVVGIKVSSGAGILGGTRPSVAEAVASGLRDAGLTKQQVIVWDRNLADLMACGYRRDADTYTLAWIDPRDGYDSKAALSAPVLGKLIWGDSRFGERVGDRFSDMLSAPPQLSNKSYYAKILSTRISKVVHIPSATDSFLTGINGALAGMTLPNLDNWRRFTKAPEHGDPYLAEIYSDEMIRGKVLLTILDALIVQYAGGPYANPNFSVDKGAIYASKDPVAIDAILLDLVEEIRKESKLPSVRSMAGYIESAASLGLGTMPSSQTRAVRVGGEAP